MKFESVVYTISFEEYSRLFQQWAEGVFEEMQSQEVAWYNDADWKNTHAHKDLISQMNNLAKRMRLVRGLAESNHAPKTVDVNEDFYFVLTAIAAGR